MINQFDIEDMKVFHQVQEFEIGDYFKFLNAPKTTYQLVGKGPGNSIQYKHPIGIVYNAWGWEYAEKVEDAETI